MALHLLMPEDMAGAGAPLPMLEISGASKAYRHGWGSVAAVSDVSLLVAPGETLGIVGESGSGKSTLARLATGLTKPDAGDVRIRGDSIVGFTRGQMRRMRRIVQMIFQDPFSSLDPRQRVGSAIEEVLAVHRIGDRRTRRDRTDEMLTKVGLDARTRDRYPHEFSGGQLQRIAIARALVLEPKLLICDEPVSALDVSVQAQILNLLRQLKLEFSLTMLFISHDLSVVAHVADRVGVMYGGHLVEIGPGERVFRHPGHPYTRQLLASVPRASKGMPCLEGPSSGRVPAAHAAADACPYHECCNARQPVCVARIPAMIALRDDQHQIACHYPIAVDRSGGGHER